MIFALTLSFKASSSNGITTLMPFSSLRDHPRGCGAHLLPQRRQLYCRGSSPRVRGSLCRQSQQRTLHGIIPAGAGLTRYGIGLCRRRRDHPRGCGAHSEADCQQIDFWGSSPRVRGSPAVLRPYCRRAGIIPAGAGLTQADQGHVLHGRDHPRGCGAHQLAAHVITYLIGSSPRVRGSLIDICDDD